MGILNRYLILGTTLTATIFSMGCVDDPVAPKNYDVNQLAFCGTVSNGSMPVSGTVNYQMQALYTPLATVMTYQGMATLDNSGLGCVQLVATAPLTVSSCGDNGCHPVDRVGALNDFQLKSLTATLPGGVLVDGVITNVDTSPQRFLSVQAVFDLANPNPGDPGMLGLLLLKKSREASVDTEIAMKSAPAKDRRALPKQEMSSVLKAI
ncbi:MAG: hypothetical protein HY074_02595 [Deltaproteobacteria bacterium]|nr:hypothetical protein [Deltaproteobacteria bacterium]